MDSVVDAMDRLLMKASSPSFSRAVGKSTVEDVIAVVNALRESKCKASIDLDEAERLLGNYYIAEHRVRDIIRRIIDVILDRYGGELKKVYPLLPAEFRDALGSAANSDDYLDRLVDALIKELQGPENDLAELVRIARQARSECGK
ncbi:hypothetical protein GCM10007981_12260 [Thermocladium modestius]|uniref:Uncharacterized protein n=1 Tax=Thermocladium modestius TaxID=62609 RepID=A0A830GVN3_9CREN|nr:hypothetical protein [Thermocladium modestius]GGP21243.1 hypothetical protein GCM10007981_12260 [Thermocladium modestius]